MKNIYVERQGLIWYRDVYVVPDDVTDETIQKCIDDTSEFFSESESLFETWDPTGLYEVIDDNDKILKSNVED